MCQGDEHSCAPVAPRHAQSQLQALLINTNGLYHAANTTKVQLHPTKKPSNADLWILFDVRLRRECARTTQRTVATARHGKLRYLTVVYFLLSDEAEYATSKRHRTRHYENDLYRYMTPFSRSTVAVGLGTKKVWHFFVTTKQLEFCEELNQLLARQVDTNPIFVAVEKEYEMPTTPYLQHACTPTESNT